MRRKNAKRGLTFTIMVAGQSGSGKTTFINTLCEASVLQPRPVPNSVEAAAEKTISITPRTFGFDF